MKKLFFIVLFLIQSTAHSSDWREVARGGADGDTIYYMEFNSIMTDKVDKSLKTYWKITNYLRPSKTESGQHYYSTKSLQTINCDTRRIYLKELFVYTELNGEGELIEHVSLHHQPAWVSIAPDSVAEPVRKILCD